MILKKSKIDNEASFLMQNPEYYIGFVFLDNDEFLCFHNHKNCDFYNYSNLVLKRLCIYEEYNGQYILSFRLKDYVV